MNEYTVQPQDVRGLGNVISEKSGEDFEKYLTSIITSTEDVNGVTRTVFTNKVTNSSLRLNLTNNTVYYGTNVLATAVLTDSDNHVVSDATVTFYSNGVIVGTSVTNSIGVAVFTLNNFDAGSYSIQAKYLVDGTYSSVVDFVVNPLYSSITVNGSVSGSSVTVSGVLDIGSGYSVDIYEDDVVVDTVTTTSNGAYSSTFSSSSGFHEYYAKFNGVTNYTMVTSDTFNLVVEVDYGLILTVTGSSFASNNNSPFTYNGAVYIDYGDGTVTQYTGGQLSHTYDTSGTYTIIVYGNVTALNTVCFYECTGLTSIDLGSSVTTLGRSCFADCNSLTSVIIPSSITNIGRLCFAATSNLTDLYLNWEDTNTIIAYDSTTWLAGSSITTFHIPAGTKNYYIAKDYPTSMLYDPIVSSVSLTSSSTVLSYVDGDTCTLTATALNDSSVAVEGATIEFFNNGTSIGTATTDSNGQATKTYTAANNGDIIFTAEETISSSTGACTVTDIYKYDDASSDKTSNYSTLNLNSLTHDTDHYVAVKTVDNSQSTYYAPIYQSSITLPYSYEISADIKYASTVPSDYQFGLCISDDYTTTYSGTNQCFQYSNQNRYALGYRVNGSLTNYGENTKLSTGTWYKFKMIVEGTSVTFKLLDEDNTQIYSSSQTLIYVADWHKAMIILGGQAGTLHWKNLQIKEL